MARAEGGDITGSRRCWPSTSTSSSHLAALFSSASCIQTRQSGSTANGGRHLKPGQFTTTALPISPISSFPCTWWLMSLPEVTYQLLRKREHYSVPVRDITASPPSMLHPVQSAPLFLCFNCTPCLHRRHSESSKAGQQGGRKRESIDAVSLRSTDCTVEHHFASKRSVNFNQRRFSPPQRPVLIEVEDA